MASQSLYRKWRSQTFSDLVGQEPVIRTLKNALKGGTPAHAYLFAGPRGTGKTSTARLLAKTINCLQPGDGEPCNECQQCREITAGNSFNVLEIDAASNRGIDNIRELREKVMVPPSTGRYKIYILDEAHMLTPEAFNALLKTLEEPPAHAIFVLATTDVHKMLPTVLSRCQRFDFKRITTQEIVSHLRFVASQEQITLEPGAAELIARAAAGGMRDALSLLDQAIAYSGQVVSLSQVQAMLGVADPRAIQKLILAIASVDNAAGLHYIHELVEAGADLRQVNNQVAEYWRAMMLAKAGAHIAEIIDATEDEGREIVQTAQLFTLEELIECARIFAQNDLIQKNQGMPQLGLELAFLNCTMLHQRTRANEGASATPVVPAISISSELASRPDSSALPVPSSPPEKQSQPVAAALQSSPQSVAQPQIVEASTIKEEPIKEEIAEPPDWDDLVYNDDGAVELEDTKESDAATPEPIAMSLAASSPPFDGGKETEPSPQEPMSDEVSTPSLSVAEVREKWEYVKRRVKSRKGGAKIAALLNGYTIFAVESNNGVPVIVIQANADFHYNTLQEDEKFAAIEWALKVELKQECRVRLLPPGGGIGAHPVVIPPPLSPTAEISSRSAAVPRQSAHREQPAPQKPAPRQSAEASSIQTHLQKPQGTEAHASTLARTQQVRENSSRDFSLEAEAGGSDVTRLQLAEAEARRDPIVRKVAEMFKAEIKDVTIK